MFEGLNLIIPALAMLAAGGLGILFVVAGWVRFSDLASGASWRSAPKPLFVFTAAVCFDLALFPLLFTLSRTVLFQGYVFGDIELPRFAFEIGFVLSAILFLVAGVLALRYADSTSRVVRWGSFLSLLIEATGAVLYAFAGHST